MSDSPDYPWRGEEPHPLTRRALIRDAIYEISEEKLLARGQRVSVATLKANALEIADAVEVALLAVEPAQSDPAPEPESIDLPSLCRRLAAITDRERGELLELAAPAVGVSGRIVADAEGKLAGFPSEARAAAFILAGLGLSDLAGQEVAE